MSASEITRLDECDLCKEPMTTDHLHELGDGAWVCFRCLMKKYTTPEPSSPQLKTSCWDGLRPSVNSMITKPLRSVSKITASVLRKAIPPRSPNSLTDS